MMDTALRRGMPLLQNCRVGLPTPARKIRCYEEECCCDNGATRRMARGMQMRRRSPGVKKSEDPNHQGSVMFWIPYVMG